MAKAGITIAVSGTYNGRALEKAREDLNKLKINTVSAAGDSASALVNFGAKAAELGGEMHNLGYKMESIGKSATKSVTLPVAAAAAACGAAAVDIDTSLTNVRKTVDGTERQYVALKDAAIEFSKTNAVSASQILDIQALGAQLGFAIDELDNFGRVVSGLDIATNMDADTAATELAQFANITKMAHADIENYGSAIVGLGNNMATTESDISHMAMRLAAAGTQVGMSQADILGLAAALSSMGVEAEAGGTAISTVISQIDKDIATGSANLEVWASTAGMTADQFAQAWRDAPVDALAALLSNMEATTAEGGNMSVMLEDLGINSLRQTDVMKRLAGNSKLVTDAVKLSNEEWRNNTALQKEVDNRNKSMSARFEILKNRVTSVAEQVGTPLINALLGVIDAAEPLIKAVENAATSFANMDKSSQSMILGLVGAAAAFGPVMTIGGKFLQFGGDIVTKFGKVSQTLGVLKSDLSKAASTFNLVKDATGSTAKGLQYASTEITGMSKACGVLKGALGGIGFALAAAAIGAIVSQVVSYIDHANKMAAATTGLETAMDAANDAYNSYSSGVGNASASLEELKAKTDDVIQAQGELANNMREQWSEVGTNAAMVNAYANEIANLTNKYDEQGNKIALTSIEQERLKMAVDGYNSATGSSIEITDAMNGLLNTSTDTILQNAEAFRVQAEQQAAMEMYKDVYKQQLEDEMALSEVTSELTRLKQLEADEMARTGNETSQYTFKIGELRQQQSELTQAIDSSGNTMERLLGIMASGEQNFESFDSAIDSLGVSMSEFGDLTDAELTEMKSSFDGTLTSIVSVCNEKGYQVPQALADALNSNSSVVYDAGYNIGSNVDAGAQQGIDDNAGDVEASGDSMSMSLIDTIANCLGVHSPSTVMAEIGRNVDLGLKQGIDGSADQPTSAITNVGNAIQSNISGLPSWMQNLGSNAGSKLSTGINSQSNNALNAAGSLNSSAKSGINPVINAMGSIGHSAASQFASVIKQSSAYSQAASLADSANRGLGSVNTQSVGRNFAAGFTSGMGGVNVWQAAWNVGQRALSAIKNALGIHSPSREAMEVGENFGLGAVIGMKSTEEDIARESERMSKAMSLSPTYGMNQGSYIASPAVNQAQRPITISMNINVNATTADQGVKVGQSIANTLYQELTRLERATV